MFNERCSNSKSFDYDNFLPIAYGNDLMCVPYLGIVIFIIIACLVASCVPFLGFRTVR